MNSMKIINSAFINALRYLFNGKNNNMKVHNIVHVNIEYRAEV